MNPVHHSQPQSLRILVSKTTSLRTLVVPSGLDYPGAMRRQGGVIGFVGILSLLLLVGCEKKKAGGQGNLNPELQAYVTDVVNDGFGSIPAERKERLRRLAAFVDEKRAAGEQADLTYICTHNSRRSHMSQLWAATAAAWYGIDGVRTYSGGTEATAFNPRAVASLERAGFDIENPGGENPHYRVKYSPSGEAMECFSKKYDDAFNPSDGFAAVMTCSAADESCPVVMGAEVRVGIPYEDPKVADGTPEEAQRYDERCRQIASEMLYLFSQVKT